MKRKLSPWCKAVKIAMIQKDWGVADLAQAVKMTKEYTSAVINGRVISEPEHTEIKYIKHAKTFLSDSTPFLDYLPKARDTATAPAQYNGIDGLPSS